MDESKSQYRGLRTGANIITSDSRGLIVRPDIASQQMQKVTQANPAQSPAVTEPSTSMPAQTTSVTPAPSQIQPKRFHGSVQLDATRLARDAGQIATEVVQHLVGIVGADISVTLEIQARIPSGANESIVRTVTEIVER